MFSADEETPQRAPDGVEREPRVVGKENDREKPMAGMIRGGSQGSAHGAPPAPASEAGDEIHKEIGSGREQAERRPHPGASRQHEPARGEQGDKRRRQQAAPQVVEDLPAVE